MMNKCKFFEHSTVLVTGATGLIGSAVVRKLIEYAEIYDINVICCVRNLEKAKKMFPVNRKITYIVCDLIDLKPVNYGVNYIIHCAGPTDSKTFVTHPVEVIETIVDGTNKVLKFSLLNPIRKFLYLSTMEVYGSPQTDNKIFEFMPGNLDFSDIRASYPGAKKLSENLCISYMKEYSIPVNIIRLTQTFGAGVVYQDKRVFAEFARCVIEQKDIILHSKGETKRNYLSINDAVNAIFTVLKNGVPGEIYNAANEETYCSIYEMADFVAKKFGKGKIKVEFDNTDDISKFGYAQTLKMNLSSEKLNSIGWKASDDLQSMFSELINFMSRETDAQN